jgi:hypothetical protein
MADYSGANFIPAAAPNYQVGRAGKPILYVVIHSIVGNASSAIAAFKNPARIASSTYIVDLNGSVTQMVRESDTPYTNGNFDINQKSITIEHGDFAQPDSIRPDALYESSARLIADICKRHNIPINNGRIFGHRDVRIIFGSGTVTACPAALDVNRLIARAQQLAAPPPPPQPEWVLNLQDIGEHTNVLEKDVPLVNMTTGEVLKNFPNGSQVTVGFKTFTGGKKYYVTRYSADKRIANGFPLEDFDYKAPAPIPEPIPEPIPVPDPIEPTPPPDVPDEHPVPLPDAPDEVRWVWTQILDFLVKLWNAIFKRNG